MQNNSDIANNVIFQSFYSSSSRSSSKEIQTQSVSECFLIENTKHQIKNNVISIWAQSAVRRAASAALLC